MSPESWIVKAIGRERADALVRSLNEEERYGVDIDIPFNGQGLMASVHRVIKERIRAGLQSGRPISVIAAECGITRRSVQLQKVKLQQLGLLPAVDATAAAVDRYCRPTSATQAVAALTVEQVDRGEETSRNVAHAFATAVSHDAELAERSTGGEDSCLSREARALAWVERMHGREACERITEACRGKKVSLTPQAVARQEHPFRSVLEETDSRLLALRIVTALGNPSPLKFFGDWRLGARSKTSIVREKLQCGEHPRAVAAIVGVSTKLVWKVKADLDREHHRRSRVTCAFDQEVER
ncbi:hypothetical protein EEDFHM_03139 [Methylorubrum populi]